MNLRTAVRRLSGFRYGGGGPYSSWRCHSTSLGKRRVAVGMSGGIDSAAAVYVLQRAGFDCVGVFMKNWDSADEAGAATCTHSRDLQDVHDVCTRLGIPYVEVSFIKDYWNDVFQPALDEYERGTSTPNPDVGCNRQIKFGRLRDYALNQLGVDFLATGHYARLGYHSHLDNEPIQIPSFTEGSGASDVELPHNSGDFTQLPLKLPKLLRGVDHTKDQSYFLSMTKGEQLRYVLFPLGGLTKKQVRAMVAAPLRGLNVLTKAESMGVCFIGKRKFSEFLSKYIEMSPGRFIDVESGAVLGQHTGRQALTAGQNARIGGRDAKYFVIGGDVGADMKAKFELVEGDVLVARGSDHPALFSKTLWVSAGGFSWVDGSGPIELMTDYGSVSGLHCKARYGQALERCSVERRGAQIRVTFENPQRSLTRGQVAVLYRGHECLGGGIISAPELEV